MSPAERRLPRFVTSIVGPGDPIWHGGPSPERIARIRAVCWVPGSVPSYRDRGPIRRIRSVAAYDRINVLIDNPV